MYIIGNVKGKFRDFFDQSKKMVQPPKELPNLKIPQPAAQKAFPAIPPNPQQNVMIRTEMPHNHATAPAIAPPRPALTLPKIDFPRPPEQPYPAERKISHSHEDDLRKFEEAISSISIDVINNESEERQETHPLKKEPKEEDYYRPSKLGEGYFSEIEHFLKNRDVKEIIDDVLTKDFLTSMKDYHDTKAQGKPFYLHNEDLKQKLEMKMNELRAKEEAWHELKKRAEESDRKKTAVEHEIDAEGQELKALFRQIKMNEWLEREAPKEHYFKLKNGQTLKNLNDLRKALSYMGDDEFGHHLNPNKNDFAAWTLEVLKNPELAEKMKKVLTKENLQELLKNPI